MKKIQGLDKFNKEYARIIKESLDDMEEMSGRVNGRLPAEDEERLFAIGFIKSDKSPGIYDGYLWEDDSDDVKSGVGLYSADAEHPIYLLVDETDISLEIHNALVEYSWSADDATICKGEYNSLDEFLADAKPAFEKYIKDGKLEKLEEYCLKQYTEDRGNTHKDIPAFEKALKDAKAQVLRFWEKFKTL